MRVLFPFPGVLSKTPITFFDQLKIQKTTRLKYSQNFEFQNFQSSRSSDESSVENLYDICRSTQNPRTEHFEIRNFLGIFSRTDFWILS